MNKHLMNIVRKALKKAKDKTRRASVSIVPMEGRNQILLGNCVEVLKRFPDNTFTAVVTDPPYGLSKHPDMREVLRHWLNGDDYEHGKRGFMGKEWDSFVPGPNVWKEIMRVLKPGGHIFSFYGTRTFDLGMTSMRIAGMEIRDSIGYYCDVETVVDWCYGSGFPKSLSIGKAIEKANGGELEVAGHVGNDELRVVDGNALDVRGATGKVKNELKDGHDVMVSMSEGARKWMSHGSALKPAREPIVQFAKSDEQGNMPEPLKSEDGAPFRYCIKVSSSERNKGCESLFWKDGTMRITEEEWKALSEENKKKKGEKGFTPHRISCGNCWPTVKPLELMRYLVRMVKMPGDNFILDPFCGSGTTLVACVLEGCHFIGVDMDAQAVEIAKARIDEVTK